MYPIADDVGRGILLEAVLEGRPRKHAAVPGGQGEVHDQEGVDLGEGGAPAREAREHLRRIALSVWKARRE